MKLSTKIENAIVDCFHHEMENWYSYLTLAQWFDLRPFPGFSAFLHAQALDELQHAQMWYHYLIERGSQATFRDITAPKWTFDTARQVIEKALELEEQTTARIGKLFDLIEDERDHLTGASLSNLLTNQTAEMKTMQGMLDLIDMADGPTGLITVDKEVRGMSAK